MVLAGVLLDGAKSGGEQETADTTGHADQAGHDADLFAKALWHQLEYRAVTSAEAEHGRDEQRQCGPGAGQVETDGSDADRSDRVHAGQRANPAKAIGKGAAQWPHHAAAKDAGGGVVACGHGAQAVLIVEITGQGAGQADETAEGHAVKEHEPPAVAVAKGFEIVTHGFGFGAFGSVFCHERESDEGQQQRRYGEAEHVVPAETGGEHWGDQCREHRSGVAGPGDAHGFALMLRRVPLRSQRQGHGERRAGHAKEYAEQQRLFIAVNAQLPGAQQRGDDDDLADDPGGLR